jgi:hypothetical protein
VSLCARLLADVDAHSDDARWERGFVAVARCSTSRRWRAGGAGGRTPAVRHSLCLYRDGWWRGATFGLRVFAL